MFCLVLVFSMRDMKLALADESACGVPTDTIELNYDPTAML
jgi:hypothetical protein